MSRPLFNPPCPALVSSPVRPLVSTACFSTTCFGLWTLHTDYLRAEILFRAKIRPFDSGRVALERADGSVTDILRATREVLAEAVEKKGRDWLNVYKKAYAAHEIDGLGRAVWYRGERGPLPSTLYEAEGAWDSLFFARLPEAMDRAALQALCSRFGPVAHVTYTRKGYAFVRFEAVESATAAVSALNRFRIFGSELHVRYKRRLRKLRPASSSASPVLPPSSSSSSSASSADTAMASVEEIDEEELMAEGDVDDAAVSVAQAPVRGGRTPAPSTPALTAARREEEEDDDEWDDPISAEGTVPASSHMATPSSSLSTPPDAFARSIRCFRAAGALAGDFQQATRVAAGPASDVAACREGDGGERGESAGGSLDFLRQLARSLNQQAETALKRQRLQ